MLEIDNGLIVENPADFMSSKIKELAHRRQDLCDGSGRGFWPVPAVFPLLLAHTLTELQRKITLGYFEADPLAPKLADIRNNLMQVAYEGDLGENHTELYVNDHPKVLRLSDREVRELPFYNFCESATQINNPLVLLGLVTRNEEGSVAEANALLATRLYRAGKFSSIHLIEEVKHAKISARIRNVMLDQPTWRGDFVKGLQVHDRLYASILK